MVAESGFREFGLRWRIDAFDAILEVMVLSRNDSFLFITAVACFHRGHRADGCRNIYCFRLMAKSRYSQDPRLRVAGVEARRPGPQFRAIWNFLASSSNRYHSSRRGPRRSEE